MFSELIKPYCIMKTVSRFIDCLKTTVDFVVGKNAQENHDIIDEADPEDLWFHVNGYPSCHVIGKLPKDIEIDRAALHKIAVQGAVVCKELSGLKKQKNVEICYTKIKNVTKGNAVGSVTLTDKKTMVI